MKRFSLNAVTISLAVLIIAVLGVTAFILYNSGQSPEKSLSYSSSVQQSIIEPIIIEPIVEDPAVIGIERLKYLVRKAGHLVEYAALSFFALLLVLVIKKKTYRFFGGVAAFYVLLVACTDELIQGRVGRVSLVSDIFLDLAGAAIGIAFAAAVWGIAVWLCRLSKKGKKRENS